MSGSIAKPVTASVDNPDVGTASLPLPYLYQRRFNSNVVPFFKNHATGKTSWLHPAKLAELQDAGFVTPRISTASFVSDIYEDMPLAPPWVKKYDDDDDNGCAHYYLNTDTDERVWRHPEALARGRGRGSREREVFLVVRHPRGDDGVWFPVEEAYFSQNVLPPWIVRETCKIGPGGVPIHCWVDYRVGQVREMDPVRDFQEFRRHISPECAREMRNCVVGRLMLPYYEVVSAEVVAARARSCGGTGAEIFHLLS